jgi:hypothetical protein
MELHYWVSNSNEVNHVFIAPSFFSTSSNKIQRHASKCAITKIVKRSFIKESIFDVFLDKLDLSSIFFIFGGGGEK